MSLHQIQISLLSLKHSTFVQRLLKPPALTRERKERKERAREDEIVGYLRHVVGRL